MQKEEVKSWENYDKKIPENFSELKAEIDQIISQENTDSTHKIRVLNDLLRVHSIGGDILITAGIHAMTQNFQQRTIQAIRAFYAFTPDNDPYKEHDFGSLHLDKQSIYFKIDYYDKDKECGSESPDNPSITSRVMTVMFSHEY